MRETHTAQASIFQTATNHEIAHELKRMSDWLDGHPELLDRVAEDLQSGAGLQRYNDRLHASLCNSQAVSTGRLSHVGILLEGFGIFYRVCPLELSSSAIDVDAAVIYQCDSS